MLSIRFSRFIRSAVKFRRRFEAEKGKLGVVGFSWYPYDSFANLVLLEQLRRTVGYSWEQLTESGPLLDLGTADGALAFFFESLGHSVEAYDNLQSNINGMLGVRKLAQSFNSRVLITDVDIDQGWKPSKVYGLVLFLGTLYHLKNPFGVLESLARCARYCFVSTRITFWNKEKTLALGTVPIAYLLDPGECNQDETNYWIFSLVGLKRLVERCGWTILALLTSGAKNSDPSSNAGDQRCFLLLESNKLLKCD